MIRSLLVGLLFLVAGALAWLAIRVDLPNGLRTKTVWPWFYFLARAGCAIVLIVVNIRVILRASITFEPWAIAFTVGLIMAAVGAVGILLDHHEHRG